MMTRKKLSLKDQLKGVTKALKSKKTPPHLKAGLRKRKKALKCMLK